MNLTLGWRKENSPHWSPSKKPRLYWGWLGWFTFWEVSKIFRFSRMIFWSMWENVDSELLSIHKSVSLNFCWTMIFSTVPIVFSFALYFKTDSVVQQLENTLSLLCPIHDKSTTMYHIFCIGRYQQTAKRTNQISATLLWGIRKM